MLSGESVVEGALTNGGLRPAEFRAPSCRDPGTEDDPARGRCPTPVLGVVAGRAEPPRPRGPAAAVAEEPGRLPIRWLSADPVRRPPPERPLVALLVRREARDDERLLGLCRADGRGRADDRVAAFRDIPRDERAVGRLERARLDGPAHDSADSARRTVHATSTASDRKFSMVFMATLPDNANYRNRTSLPHVNYFPLLIIQHGPIGFQ